MTTTTIVSDFLDTIDHGVVGFFTGGAASIARGAYTPFVIMLGVSVIVWWIMVAYDFIEEPISDGLKRFGRIIIVVSLAFSMSIYNGLIAKVIYAAPTEFAGLLLGGSSTSANSLIDTALEQGNNVAIAFKDQAAGWKPGDAIGWYLTALVIWIFVAVVCTFAAALLVVSKLALGLMIAFGPAAIICYLFRPTRSLFDGWLRQTITIILTYVMVAASISLLFSLWKATLDVAIATATNGFSSFLPAVIVGGAGIVLLHQSMMLARGIGGGWHIDTQHAVGWTWGKATGAAGAIAGGALTAGKFGYGKFRDREPKNRSDNDKSKKWPAEDAGYTNVVRTYHHQQHHPQLGHSGSHNKNDHKDPPPPDWPNEDSYN